MPIGEGLFGLAALALWIYCIFDVIRTDSASVENLPKLVWLVIVVFVPTIGSIAWLLLGRPRGASFRLELPASGADRQSHPSARPPPPAAPPTISSEEHQRRREEALRRHEAERAEREEQLRIKEEELRRREEELRRREGEIGDTPAN